MPLGKDIDIYSSYPTGALIQDNQTGGIYYVQNGIKYPILAKEMLLTNYPNYSILQGHSTELDKYPKGEAVKFKNNTLIKAKEDNKVYLVADGKKLPIVDEKAFVSRGYAWNKIIETNQAAIDIHPTGPALEAISSYLLPQENVLSTTTADTLLPLASTTSPDSLDEIKIFNNNPATTTLP
jgi:hypothetical protein